MTTITTTTPRETGAGRHLLDFLKKNIPFAQGLVVSTLPRGELQIVQPSSVSDLLLKTYAGGLHAEDAITWQAILRQKPVRSGDVGSGDFTKTAYYRELMQPVGLRYVAAAPLTAPVLRGYPGAVHLARTEQQGDFTNAELQKLAELVRKFEETSPGVRGSRRSNTCTTRSAPLDRPAVYVNVVDEHFKSPLPGSAWSELDARLKGQMVDRAKRQMHSLNGHTVAADRVQLADSHGDFWVFRQVTYKRYPALGSGSFSFFCLQPDCCEWGVVKPSDFQADPELSRLVPALRFMEQDFSRGPSLTEISQTVGLSPFHFHRRFTELLGLTPKQFMLNCQVYQAKADLLAGDKELVDIARECGFAHQSHFTSRFKQATGLTPTRWRRMARQRRQASDN